MTSKTDHKQAGSDAQAIADEKARKEELVEARIRAARKKNEELMKRQQEIEEDRRNANKYSDMVVKKHHEHPASGVAKDSPAVGRGRGRGRGLLLQEMRKETLRAKEWEAKRRENIKREEEERNRGSNTSRAGSFLVDDDRVDMSRTTGRNEHSWGGANFNKVVNRVQKEKEGFRSGRSKGNIEMTMSGKERREYNQWKEERRKIDEERKTRQKREGNWSRAWDQKKTWDARKKMWMYEDGNDDYNDARRRKQSDDSEDWGDNSMRTRQDNRGRGRGEQRPRQGFIQHDERKTEASEEWGDPSEDVVTHNKVSWSKKETDTKDNHQHGAMSGLGGGEDWEEEELITSDNKVESSVVSKEVTSDHVENNAPEHQKGFEQPKELNDSETNKQFDDNRDSQKEESVTVVVRGQSHSDAPKPQRQLKERRKPHDAIANDQLESRDWHKEQESATEEMSLVSGENNLPKPPASKDQHEHINVESKAVSDEQKHEDEGGETDNTVTMDNKKGSTAPETTAVKEQQVASTQSAEVKTNNVESTRAQKADLPKLITNVDKKVTFDAEENELKTESESKDRAMSLDIPPTPDFLKVDHSVNWGDFEIDEEEVVERW